MSILQTVQTPSVTVWSDPDVVSWFAVCTRARHEKKVAAQLARKEIESYLPLVAENHRWSDRRRTVEMPLFPGYIFVRVANLGPARLAVLSTPGVASFVGTRGEGTPIPEKQIEDIRSVVSSGISFKVYPYLEVGQRVKILGGCLEGVEGILLATNPDRSVLVSVNLVQRSLAVRVEGFEVEVIRS